MSDFLNSLNKNAKTESEYANKINQENNIKKMKEEEQKKQHENYLKNNFDITLKQFIVEIKELCIEAVSEACYITYNDKRYILCIIALMQSYNYDTWDGDHFGCWLQFNCYKLEKNHIIESKREYKKKEITKGFNYIEVINDNAPLALGCRRIENTKRFSAPDYINLAASVKCCLDGYTDIQTLPNRIITANTPPGKKQSSLHFTRPIIEHWFLIEF